MALNEGTIESLALRYVKPGMVLALGTSGHSETFLKKIAFEIEEKGLNVSVVPTSHRIAELLASLKIPVTSLNENEIDVAFEFVSQVDRDFNFVKTDSTSLVRDKMIAQSAEELIVVAGKKDFVERISGTIPFEIVHFGWKRTIIQLEKLGEAHLRKIGGKEYRTESNNLVADVKIDDIYDLYEIESQAKEVPGVIETGLFIGYADRIILHNHGLEVKSRLDFEKSFS
ncbi:MAG: ribose 5-phosphate isomerase A [Candidatus ainarchaeum sp.]|nr:ribose 5-phosphate isomerase A [Candidatus ainarchaeum sp.]